MVRRLAIILVIILVAAGCGRDDDADTTTTSTSTSTSTTTTPPTATQPPPGAEANIEITEVVFGADGYVAVTNFGDASADVGGWQLCQRPRYLSLPQVVIEPGEVVLFAFGDTTGLDGNVAEIGGGLGTIDAGDGEIGLYTSSAFGNPNAIVTYVEWGSSGHGRSAVAVEAAIWGDGDFVPTENESVRIVKTTADEVGDDDWIQFSN